MQQGLCVWVEARMRHSDGEHVCVKHAPVLGCEGTHGGRVCVKHAPVLACDRQWCVEYSLFFFGRRSRLAASAAILLTGPTPDCPSIGIYITYLYIVKHYTLLLTPRRAQLELLSRRC